MTGTFIYKTHQNITRNVSETYMPPLGAKFKITTYMYKAIRIQNFVQGRTKH